MARFWNRRHVEPLRFFGFSFQIYVVTQRADGQFGCLSAAKMMHLMFILCHIKPQCDTEAYRIVSAAAGPSNSDCSVLLDSVMVQISLLWGGEQQRNCTVAKHISSNRSRSKDVYGKLTLVNKLDLGGERCFNTVQVARCECTGGGRV